jgi:hypothetical protein
MDAAAGPVLVAYAVALARERQSYMSRMEALGKEAALDRLVDQFLAAEEQLKQEPVDRAFPASPGY